ncbi:hypothetical protein DIPPA_20808 [Diplonema papillatum]|nr:hypothetical protein DIPPA_20808 [Diplonema papillatum]
MRVAVKLALTKDDEVDFRRLRLRTPSLGDVEAVAQSYMAAPVVLQYVDTEGDAISLGSEHEWQECLRLFRKVWRTGVRLDVRCAVDHPADDCRSSPAASPACNPTAPPFCCSAASNELEKHSLMRASGHGSNGSTGRDDLFEGDRTSSVKDAEDPLWEATATTASAPSTSVFAEDAAPSAGHPPDSIALRVLHKLYAPQVVLTIIDGTAALCCGYWLAIRKLQHGRVKFLITVPRLMKIAQACVRSASCSQEYDEWTSLRLALAKRTSCSPGCNLLEEVITKAEASWQPLVREAKRPAEEAPRCGGAAAAARAHAARPAEEANKKLSQGTEGWALADRVRQLENMGVRVTPLMIEDVAACNTHGELQSLTEKLLS